MSETGRLIPRQPVPELQVPTLSGETWSLARQSASNFFMIVFYRGLHCPICRVYLRDLDTKMDEFRRRGIDVIAVSTDTRERAARSQQEWGLEKLTVGYGLPIEEARGWGLYISRAIKEGEAAEFAEPGLFLINPDRTLYAAQISTMPFARPSFEELLKAIDFILEKKYPPRGEA